MFNERENMKPGKIGGIMSYIFPLQVEATSSQYNSFLEILLSNGKYLMNSERSNYSFGSLHKIFESTFRDIKLENLNISNCLVLGLGGGSVVELIKEKYKSDMPITAVEIDPVVIQLGYKYFDFGNYKDLTIVNDDAYGFVKSSDLKYDLIIIDLYISDEVPGEFHTKEFVLALQNSSHNNTIILFNKMLGTKTKEKEFNTLVYEMSQAFGTVSFLSYVVHGVENKIICVNTGRVHEKQRSLRENLPLKFELFY